MRKKDSIDIEEMDDGIQVITEGNYGNITLKHELKGKRGVRGRQFLCYRLGGYRTKEGHFPGSKEWNEAIYQMESSDWLSKNKNWRIALMSAEISLQVNEILIPILMESIKQKRVYSKKKRDEYQAEKILRQADAVDDK